MDVVESKWYEMDMPLNDVKKLLSANIKTMSRSFIAAGYYMKYIRDRELFRDGGYNSIWEFAEDQYGIKKSAASRWMAMNDKFSKDGNSPILDDKYKDFNKSQLQEMLYLTDEQMEEAEPEMSAKEIRAIRKPPEVEVIAPAQQIDDQIPGQDSIEQHSLALEYKLEYDMDDTGLVKQIDANREAAASLKEDLEGIAKKHVNLLENLQFYPGEFYTYESHNVSENSDFGRFELFNINANENYYFIDIFSSFSCVKYDDGSYSRIENTTTGFVSGIFKPTQNGVVAITGVRSSSSKNTLFTSSKEMYENKIYESYLSFSEKASDEVRKIMDYLPKTYYVEKDESGDFVKLSDAIVTATKYMDSVVYLGDGTWDLIEEFGSDFFNNATGGGAPRSPVRGLLLKNRIHIIGSSKSKIICNYTGDNAVIKKWFSVFNSDIYGFTLENITIEASNIRYIIHDERDSDTDSYINRYINCHFKFDNSDNDTPGRTAQCIGGGLGIDGYIDINGGVFESIDATKTGHICVVSYHNSAGANAKNHISIKNTYLKALGYFRINSYGESTEITECEITNCSMGRSVLIGHETGGSNMNINVTQWNNEIR